MSNLSQALLATAIAIAIFILCPYLNNPTYAAQSDCDAGHIKACAWLADADAVDKDNTCRFTYSCSDIQTTTNPFTH